MVHFNRIRKLHVSTLLLYTIVSWFLKTPWENYSITKNSFIKFPTTKSSDCKVANKLNNEKYARGEERDLHISVSIITEFDLCAIFFMFASFLFILFFINYRKNKKNLSNQHIMEIMSDVFVSAAFLNGTLNSVCVRCCNATLCNLNIFQSFGLNSFDIYGQVKIENDVVHYY